MTPNRFGKGSNPMRQSEEATGLDVEAAILENAIASAIDYWQRWLWNEPEMLRSPKDQFCANTSETFGTDISRIREIWHKWFGILTSREYAFTLITMDMERIKTRDR